MNYEFIAAEHCPQDVLDMLYTIMYEPWGVDRNANWADLQDDGVFNVARDEHGLLMGIVRLMPTSYLSSHGTAPVVGEAPVIERVIRQVVIANEAQGKGVGRFLMGTCEDIAKSEGATHTGLGARFSAYGFYEKLGYSKVGDEYLSGLTKIPHTHMVKYLR